MPEGHALEGKLRIEDDYSYRRVVFAYLDDQDVAEWLENLQLQGKSILILVIENEEDDDA